MLSIVTRGNGTAAQAYYEHLATGKDRQIEDYYAKNEQGRWVGRGAEVLGLSGPVRREEFQYLAFGFDPKTGKALVRQAGEQHRSGWDLTFSAPKSVSVAWALGDDETQAKIAAAHDRAVDAALSYMERHAAFCRTGHAGKDEMQADLSCAVYRHYT
ncbi:Conjugal protein, TraA, partial [mine drainage metagenome]